MIDFRQIECFCAVARSGSFSRAAAILSMDQSGLSRQVRRLEESVRSKLLYRNGRGVELTESGMVFHETVSEAMSALRRAYDRVSEATAVPYGRVSLALPPSLSAVVAVPLLLQLRARWPDIKLHLVDGFTDTVQEALVTGRVDMAVLRDHRVAAPLWHPLLQEELYLLGRMPPEAATRCSHSGRWRIAAKALLDLPLIIPAWDQGLRSTLKEIAKGQPPNIVDDTHSLVVTREMMRSHAAYAVLPVGGWDGEIAAGDLVACRIGEPALQNNWSISCASNRPYTMAMREVSLNLCELVETTAREREGWVYASR